MVSLRANGKAMREWTSERKEERMQLEPGMLQIRSCRWEHSDARGREGGRESQEADEKRLGKSLEEWVSEFTRQSQKKSPGEEEEEEAQRGCHSKGKKLELKLGEGILSLLSFLVCTRYRRRMREWGKEKERMPLERPILSSLFSPSPHRLVFCFSLSLILVRHSTVLIVRFFLFLVCKSIQKLERFAIYKKISTGNREAGAFFFICERRERKRERRMVEVLFQY